MSVYGELPRHPVVFAACDSGYFMEHAQAFVYSANDVGKDVHIHVVNPTAEVLSLSALLNATTKVKTTFSFNDHDFKAYQHEMIRTYYACLRFMMIPHIVRTAGKVLILDIDCYIMKPFNFDNQKAVGYYPREPLPGTVGWESEGTRVAAGAVYIADQGVADAIAQGISKIEMRWFADQIVLSKIFAQIPEQHVVKYDSQFMDWEFKEGTTIWTGKGARKYDNDKYVQQKKVFSRLEKELQKYDSVILIPRMDIPFKQLGVVTENMTARDPIRDHWTNFVYKIVDEKREFNENPLIVQSARWIFNSTIENWFPDYTVFYIPHVEKDRWGGNDSNIHNFYMQTVFPWMFTIDPVGWSGGLSWARKFDNTIQHPEGGWETMKKYINSGQSKFKHLQHESTDMEGIDEEFILVPLQLPHDETIKYHSKFTTETFVAGICAWASVNKDVPQIVFKGHPVNLKAMDPLIEIINKYPDSRCKYISEGNIQELIKLSKCVFVQNGGSGQEAMLLEKPVVVFADAEYNDGVIQGDIFNMGHTWRKFILDDPEARIETYKNWYNWYVPKCYTSIR